MEKYIKAINNDCNSVLRDIMNVFGSIGYNTTLGSGNSNPVTVKARLPGIYRYRVKVANLKKRLRKYRQS